MNTPLITSRQNPRVKLAAALRVGSERRKAGLHLIDGAREIRRALEAGVRPVEAFVGEGYVSEKEVGEKQAELVALLKKAGAEVLPVTAVVYEKLCFGERDEVGVVVVAETPRRGLGDLKLAAGLLKNGPLVAVIEGVEKPGNVGAILRSADAAGVDAVIVADGATDLFNPNTIRASLGTVFRENVVATTAAESIPWLRERGMRVFAARPDAEMAYTSADFRGGVAIVLGSEAEGLSDAWRGVAIQPVRVPMCGVADSLNVSATAAVLFYEAMRQRKIADNLRTPGGAGG